MPSKYICVCSKGEILLHSKIVEGPVWFLVPACLLACLPTYLLTHLLAYLLACVLVCLLDLSPLSS